MDRFLRAVVDGELTAVDAAKAKWWTTEIMKDLIGRELGVLYLSVWSDSTDLSKRCDRRLALMHSVPLWWCSHKQQEVIQMTAQNPSVSADSTNAETDLVSESLVEEVSIDGMCGVY